MYCSHVGAEYQTDMGFGFILILCIFVFKEQWV